MGKRKAEANGAASPTKKGKSSNGAPASIESVESSFDTGLFDAQRRDAYRDEYSTSGPYKHAVIRPLIADSLLRSVRKEILNNLHFTPKETDIYRIHQTGDLTNITGLPKPLQAKLSSLKTLRDSLYSKEFRDYVCAVTGCGALSGKKTDMAVNVYTPGCHLLTHDDVIGSRRISYILYLTDPDKPWKPEYGGALRLYPTVLAEDGVTKVPTHDWIKVIPPEWNQLSFFEVVPGESFHDVEEVFDPEDEGEERVRMAISGWFHIPQPGEEGFIEGLEEELGKKSSLQSLQSKADVFERPRPQVVAYGDAPAEKETTSKGKGKAEESEEEELSEEDLDFLLGYIAPTYLTPDTLEQLSEAFAEESSVNISDFLRPVFAKQLKEYIESLDGKKEPVEGWDVAVPPHKQRFLFLQPDDGGKGKAKEEADPIRELLNVLFPSKQFKKLLELATGMKIKDRNVVARRFRRELDYTLATALPEKENGEEEGMRLEICLGLTPSKGWGADEEEEENEDEEMEDAAEAENKASSSKAAKKGKKEDKKKDKKNGAKPKVPKRTKFDDSTRSLGGYEMYMSSDPDENEKSKELDPAVAIARKEEDEDEDDRVLFTNPPVWNGLSIVLRDQGILKFVKYVSRKAAGDRWDVVGEFGVEPGEDDEDEDEDEEEE